MGDARGFFIASLALFMPLAINAPIASEAGMAAALELLITEGSWAVHRYPADRRAEQVSFGTFLVYGAGTAVGYVLLSSASLLIAVFLAHLMRFDTGTT